MLQKQGYNIYGYDPYHRVEGTMKLDYAGNKATMERICKDIKDNGLFDVVVCDSVLNSVDSMMAEESVIASVGALCKQDGMIFISGRPKEDSDRRESAKKCITKGDSLMHFLDENNFSALYRNGEWFYQKFHTADEQKRILLNYGHEIDGRVQSSNTSFQVSVKKTKTMDVQRCVDALRFEFNLILPNDKSYGMQDAIEEAYRYAVGKN